MALCEGFFVDRKTIVDLISHHQDNLGRAVLALSFWATSGGGGVDVGVASESAEQPDVILDSDETWSRVKQLLLGSSTSSPTIERPTPMTGVAEFFGLDVQDSETETSASMSVSVSSTQSSTDFLQCLPGLFYL